MSWNFDYIIPTLIVLIFFLVFYFLKPVYLTRSNRCFLTLVISEIIGFALETYSCHIDVNRLQYNKSFIIFINTISLIFFVFRYFLISVYLSSILHVDTKKDIPTKIAEISFATIFALIVTNPFTSLLYNITDEGQYFRSKYYIIFYIACIIPLITGLYYLIRFGKKLELSEKIAIILSNVTLLISCIIKIFFEHYLITDAIFVFILLGSFFMFENPNILIDKRTGLLNFSAYHEIISEYIANKRNFSIISFTIKNYNEKRQIYGAMQSELALKEIGKFFLSLSHYRKSFYLRNGNFVILERNKKNIKKIKKIVSQRFEKPWNINNANISFDLIIIDVENNVKFNTFDELTAAYDFSFVDAINHSLNAVTITKDSLSKISRKAKVSKALNKALSEDNLQIYFQPIINATTRKIVAAEALVRIYDEELGLIPPVEFINMAEKNGSIEQLGEQVLNKVCIFLKESEIYKHGIEWINVNLSPIQCQNKDLLKKFDNIVSTSIIDHKYIHLEITEEAIIDTEVLKNQMNVLIGAGYKISLDDFGSGFSNVYRVQMLPFNNIKLDMGIVREHFNHPDDILPSVVKSFNNKDLTVTAEGVETKDMADKLEKMGCKYLQGYYFSKPIPAQDFEKLITQPA